MQISGISFILYVADQARSKSFYAKILQSNPVLDEEGMTEFKLCANSTLGLISENNITKILGTHVPHPMIANGIPRCELYLYVDDPKAYFKRTIEAGGKSISEFSKRDWGHEVAYALDPDGNVLAFASK